MNCASVRFVLARMSEEYEPPDPVEDAELSTSSNNMLPCSSDGSGLIACSGRLDVKAELPESVQPSVEFSDYGSHYKKSEFFVDLAFTDKNIDSAEEAIGKECTESQLAQIRADDEIASPCVAAEETTVGNEYNGFQMPASSAGFVNDDAVVADDETSCIKQSDGSKIPLGFYSEVDASASVEGMTNASLKESNTSDMPSSSLMSTTTTSYVANEEIVSDEANDGSTMVPLPEKKVGTLVAAAMKKYAAPRSSNYHGVTK